MCCKHETFTQCWYNVGPPSATLAQHWCQHWVNTSCLLGMCCTCTVTESVQTNSRHQSMSSYEVCNLLQPMVQQIKQIRSSNSLGEGGPQVLLAELLVRHCFTTGPMTLALTKLWSSNCPRISSLLRMSDKAKDVHVSWIGDHFTSHCTKMTSKINEHVESVTFLITDVNQFVDLDHLYLKRPCLTFLQLILYHFGRFI